jgi:hypothetical protein
MPAPIDKIGAKLITPQTELKPGSAKFSLPKPDAAESTKLPPTKPVVPVEKKTIEHDLRKRIEAAGSQDPMRLFGADMKDLKMRVDTASKRIQSLGKQEAAGGLRDRLSSIEAQFNASESKLKNIPDNNNLRDLLGMQTEMYKMSQNIELLSKAVDAATSGVKQTLQTQV